MRKIALISIIGLSASLALAGGEKVQPLDIKTGLWQSTMTLTFNGLPPMEASFMPKTITQKMCLTKKNLGQYPFLRKNCTLKVMTSTGSKMDVTGDCVFGEGYMDHFTGHLHVLDSEHVEGTETQAITGGGRTMTADYKGTGKYVGPACGNVH